MALKWHVDQSVWNLRLMQVSSNQRHVCTQIKDEFQIFLKFRQSLCRYFYVKSNFLFQIVKILRGEVSDSAEKVKGEDNDDLATKVKGDDNNLTEKMMSEEKNLATKVEAEENNLVEKMMGEESEPAKKSKDLDTKSKGEENAPSTNVTGGEKDSTEKIKFEENNPQHGRIFVNCDGELPADQEALVS